MVFTGEPFEEALQGREQDMLGTERKGLAIGFAVVVEMTLVTLQHLPGDVMGSLDVSLITPDNKAPQGRFAAPERVLGVALPFSPFHAGVEVGREAVTLNGGGRGAPWRLALGQYSGSMLTVRPVAFFWP